jgi:hypothetical protein
MKARFFVALAVLGVSQNAFGQEGEASAEVSTEGSTEASASAPAENLPPIAATDTFAAPNGQYGAGLSISGVKTKRLYGELAFYNWSPGPMSIWSFSAIVGGGYKLQENLELEAMLPLSFFSASGGIEDETGAAVGNLHLGANFVGTKDVLRYKVGGALQWAPWTIDPGQNFALALATGFAARSIHDGGLWLPETLSIVAPARVETGDQLVLGADAQVGVHIPTGSGGDVELSLQLDPGVGFWASETVLVGGRIPIVWVPTGAGDNAQIAVEPYARFDFGSAFFNTRFTLNIDDPLGFSFDDGKVWALHLGFGAAI